MLGRVGPGSLAADESTPKGFLKVYTATENHKDGDMHYFPNTGYTVCSEDGRAVVKKVANAISIHDEDPSLVQLPAGKYVVLAEAEESSKVRIMVIIKPGQFTKIDLQHDWKQSAPSGKAADWARLPNG